MVKFHRTLKILPEYQRQNQEFYRIFKNQKWKTKTKDHHSDHYKFIITGYLPMHHLFTYKTNVREVVSKPNRCFIWNKIMN